MDLSEITALVLTYNEQQNVRRTLGALTWAKQVVVIDSFSTDRTVELARAAHSNVQIVQRPFDTHGAQWNFGLEQVRTPWVLALDADYQLPPEFERELSRIDPAEEVTGYEAEFVYCIFGQPLRATLYPSHTILFRKERGRYTDEGHTQALRLSGNVRRLNSRILHDDRKPLSRWMVSQDRYSILEARHLLAARAEDLNAPDRLRRRIFFAPLAVFFYLLVGKGLILDGWRGWYYVLQRLVAEALLSLRLLTEREGMENDADHLERGA
jgi:glycosyltransferase involved in cell wall biosynthesis